MTADLSALIARLEAAEVGSRELDAAVCDALNWRKTDGVWVFPAPVSQSLDAALALAEGVLGGAMGTVSFGEGPSSALLYGTDRVVEARAQTSALALCIAILRAKQEPKP